MSEIENLKIGNGGTLHIVGNEDIIANEWEAGQVYIENRSYVIREHKLLMCNTTHTSVEPFDPDKWTEKNIGEALGTAGSANMIECTLAEYNAWKAGGQLINETVYVITDAPNLNATAQEISYDGGADTVYDKLTPTQNYSSGGLSIYQCGDLVTVGINNVHIDDLLTALASYATSYAFRPVVWNVSKSRAAVISMKTTPICIDTSPWGQITGTDKLHGGFSFILK